ILQLNDPTKKPKKNSLLSMVNDREYLKTPVTRLCDDICQLLTRSIPLMFRARRPKDENDFNDKVDGVLNSRKEEFEREHPCASFARAKVIPDHLDVGSTLLVESKYVRGSTTPSKVTDGLAADMFKIPSSLFRLFVVYDPDRAVADDENFRESFESKGNCRVL